MRIPDTPAFPTVFLAAFMLATLSPDLSAQSQVFELEGLVVTASPAPRPAEAMSTHVTVLEGDELRARGLVRLQEALREVAGLSVVQSGSFGGLSSVFFRGGENDYVQVLVDGVEMNQPGGAFDFSGLTLENVERIEVVRGPASALYGSDAVSGVIHVITRSGSGATSGSSLLQAGSYGTVNASLELSGGAGAFGYGFSLSRQGTDGVLELNNNFTNTVFSGTARLRADSSTTARLAVRYSDREFHYPTDGSGNAEDANAFTFGDEISVSLAISRLVSDRLELQTLLTAYESDSGIDDQPDGPGDATGFFAYTSLDDLRRLEADLRANLHLGRGTTATVGLSAEEQTLRSFSESMSEFGTTTGRSDNSRWNRGGYAHIVAETGSLAFNAGLRLEDNERFGSFFTYQVGSSVGVREGTRIRASVGRGIKEPTFYENYTSGFATGNPDLEPEQSTSLEVGLDHTALGDRLTVRTTYFHQLFRELIQYTFAPLTEGGPNYYNVAEAKARGLELGASFVHGPVRVMVDHTVLDTEVEDSGFDEGEGATFVEGQRLLRRPRHTTSLRSTLALGERVRLSGSVLFVGERDDRDFSTYPASPVILDGYAALGLGVEATLVQGGAGRAGFDLLLRADNLLDEAYQEVFGFQAPGRGVYLGGRLRFGGGAG